MNCIHVGCKFNSSWWMLRYKHTEVSVVLLEKNCGNVLSNEKPIWHIKCFSEGSPKSVIFLAKMMFPVLYRKDNGNSVCMHWACVLLH